MNIYLKYSKIIYYAKNRHIQNVFNLATLNTGCWIDLQTMSVLGPSFQVQTRSTIWMFNHDQHGRQHEVQHLNFGLGSFLGCHVGVYDRCAFIVRDMN